MVRRSLVHQIVPARARMTEVYVRKPAFPLPVQGQQNRRGNGARCRCYVCAIVSAYDDRGLRISGVTIGAGGRGAPRPACPSTKSPRCCTAALAATIAPTDCALRPQPHSPEVADDAVLAQTARDVDATIGFLPVAHCARGTHG